MGRRLRGECSHEITETRTRLQRVRRPKRQEVAAPLGHLLDHLVGDLRDGVLGHGGPVDVIEMRGDLAGRESLGGQRQYDLVDTGQPSLALLDDHRIEGAVGVPRHLDLDRADLGEHRLGPSPIAGIARPAPNGVVFVIAQVLGHLRIQRGLEHVLGQLVEQAVRADQLDTLFLRLRKQLRSELQSARWHKCAAGRELAHPEPSAIGSRA